VIVAPAPVPALLLVLLPLLQAATLVAAMTAAVASMDRRAGRSDMHSPSFLSFLWFFLVGC
jgi:hypothetical protein